jgi:hypothetical protein
VITILTEKLEILNHQKNFINFVESLQYLDEYVLRQPIREGKWSIIEIIGHFYFWDEFVLQKRLPFILTGNPLPPSPNANVLNKQSSLLARHEHVHRTIEKCILIRTTLIEALNAIPDENWLVEFNINQTRLTLYEYLKGLMEHDIHHIHQIKSAIVSI